MNKETLTVERNKRGTVTYRNASGQLHNENGPAVVYHNGDKSYYINGKRHNPDGPAVVGTDGYKLYLINGKLHNPNGPAVIGKDDYKEHWINGKYLTGAGFKTWQAKQPAK